MTIDEYEINWADAAADEMAHVVNMDAAQARADDLIARLHADVQFFARVAAVLVLCMGLLVLSCAERPSIQQRLYQAVCVDEGACK